MWKLRRIRHELPGRIPSKMLWITPGSRDFHLIEAVAELLAAGILGEFPTSQVRVLVRKISPVLEPRVNYVSVEIVRSR